MSTVNTLPGLYEVLPERAGDRTRIIPVLKIWTCGDGCCAEWEPEAFELEQILEPYIRLGDSWRDTLIAARRDAFRITKTKDAAA